MILLGALLGIGIALGIAHFILEVAWRMTLAIFVVLVIGPLTLSLLGVI
jgi:hypothetical protein